MKKFTDFHLYFGCSIADSADDNFIVCPSLDPDFLKYILESNRANDFKPILRQLNNMTEEEAREIWDSSMERTGYKFNHRDRLLQSVNRIEVIAPVIPKLLSRGFDLFGLIPEGLAIDSKTLKPE